MDSYKHPCLLNQSKRVLATRNRCSFYGSGSGSHRDAHMNTLLNEGCDRCSVFITFASPAFSSRAKYSTVPVLATPSSCFARPLPTARRTPHYRLTVFTYHLSMQFRVKRLAKRSLTPEKIH